MAKLPAQAPFFKFVSGWRNNIIQELPQNYISCGSATQDYRHLVHTEGFSLSGDSLYSHSFGVDTASYTYATYTNSVLKIGPTNYTAINFKPENDPYLHGLLLKFNEDFSDTIATKLYTNDGIDSRRLLIIEQKNDTTLMLGSYKRRGQWRYSSFMETDTLGYIRWQKERLTHTAAK